MKASPYIFILLIIETYSVLPTWNLVTSPIDLLKNTNSYTYKIDYKNGWYGSSDWLRKTIKKENGKITLSNKFSLHGLGWSPTIYETTVDFEAIESFYNSGGEANNKIGSLIICP